jgi:hypothetical protein
MPFCKKFQISVLEENSLNLIQTIRNKFHLVTEVYIYFLGQNLIELADSLPLYLRRISKDYPLYIQFHCCSPIEIPEEVSIAS